MKEKFSYGLGDTSCNIVFTLVSALAVYFYTNVIGMSAMLAGSIVGISCIFDGISDAVVGVLVDRTQSKHGKTRVWILRMIIPYGVSSVLLFMVPPNAVEWVQAIYAFITYNLVVTVVYTSLNLPYGALAAMMTRDQHQRTVINIYRMALAPVGALLVTTLTLPLVNRLGGGQQAWIMVTIGYAIVSMILLWICFKNTKERVIVQQTASGEELTVKDSLKSLVVNKYWWMVFVIFLGWALTLTIRGMMTTYYAQYHLGNVEYMSVLSFLETIPNIPIAILILPLVKKYGKRNLSLIGAVMVLVGQVLIVAAPTNFMMLSIAAVIKGIGAGPVFAVAYSFLADSVEYGQWRTGVRNEGMLFAAAPIGYKLGTAATSAIIGYLLDTSGFKGELMVQSMSAQSMIGNLYVYAPFIAWGVMAAVLWLYKLDKEYPSIIQDLQEGKYFKKK